MLRIFLFSIILILCYYSKSKAIDTSNSDFVIVETEVGSIMGTRRNNLNVFLGIPYAEPPIAHNRFRPPQTKRTWFPSTYRALNYAPECLQSTLYSDDTAKDVEMSEDCLYLNIWQPISGKPPTDTGKKKGLPVMVWIYGGAFIHGSANRVEYEGSRLAERGVVVVSLNYRLGALGFLVSTADGLYGNYGLGDQKMALQWVQDHIERFGGDPARVTLFGESAGAMSIGLHFLDQQRYEESVHANMSGTGEEAVQGSTVSGSNTAGRQQLFQAVILQSNPLGYKYRSVAVASFIGTSYKQQLDCDDLRCLQSESPEELLHVQDTLMAVPRSIGDFFTWGPVVTDAAYYREARLRPGPLVNVSVSQPVEAFRDLQLQDVPVMIGTNTHEGSVFVFTAYPTRMTKLVYQALVLSFFRSSGPRVLRMYAPLAQLLGRSVYPDYRLVLSRIIGDYLFRCPNQHVASQLVAAGASVFQYEFALPTRTPGFPCCDGLACHTSELPYVFNQLGLIEAEYSWRDSGFVSPSPAQPHSMHSSLAVDSVGTAGTGGMGDLGRHLLNAFTGSHLEGGIDVGDRTDRADRPLGVLSETASQAFPDIFGAVSESDIPGPHHHREPPGPHKPRQLVDAEVSRVMADFWVAFAAYGDPNGEPERQSGAGGMSGYALGTRPDQAPWWPRLMGDIPGAGRHRLPGDRNSAELREEAEGEAAGRYFRGESMQHTEDRAELGSSDPLASLKRGMVSESTQAYSADTTVAEAHIPAEDAVIEDELALEIQQDNTEPVIRSAVGRDLGEGGEQADAMLLSPSRRGTSPGALHTHHSSMNGAENMPDIKKQPSYRLTLPSQQQQQQQRAHSVFLKLQSRHFASAARFMHHMVFDEQSSVNIIENDCICSAWNQMEYRF